MLLLLWLHICVLLWSVGAREVQVSVTAPWSVRAAHPMVEAAQFLWDYDSPTAYWKHIDMLCDRSHDVDAAIAGSSMEAHEASRSLAAELALALLPTSLHALFESAIEMKMYGPYVQFLESTSPSTSCSQSYAILEDGSHLCEPRSFSLSSSSTKHVNDSHAYPTDHMFPSSSSSSPVVTLVGVPGSSSFCVAHRFLYPLATAGVIRYASRPSFHAAGAVIASSQHLPAYGAYLDIKNMEYRNVDDSAASSDGDALPSEPIQGVNLATLASRKPELTKELIMLREELVSAVDTRDAKVWQVQDLGLQATHHILTSNSPIATMIEVTSAFPSHAARLSSHRVQPQLREAAEIHFATLAQQLPRNAMFINGLRFDLQGSTFNFYNLLDTLISEVKQAQFFSGMPSSIREAVMSSIAHAASGSRSSMLVNRVDVSHGGKLVVTFLNNLEKDSVYRQLPRSVSQLLQPSWSLHQLARNLYTFIAHADPLSEEGALLILQVRGLHQNHYPVRLGIQLVCSDGIPSADGEASRSEMCQLFASLKDKMTPRDALSFIYSLAEEAAEGKAVSRAKLIEKYVLVRGTGDLFRDKNKYSAEASALLLDGTYLDFAVNSTRYTDTLNLPANSYSLNGAVYPAATLQSSLMHLLGREQYILSQLVAEKRLKDTTKNIFGVVMSDPSRSRCHVWPRYHPIIEESDAVYLDMSNSEPVLGAAYAFRTQHRNVTIVITDVNSSFSLQSLLNIVQDSTLESRLQILIHSSACDDAACSVDSEYYQRLMLLSALTSNIESIDLSEQQRTDLLTDLLASLLRGEKASVWQSKSLQINEHVVSSILHQRGMVKRFVLERVEDARPENVILIYNSRVIIIGTTKIIAAPVNYFHHASPVSVVDLELFAHVESLRFGPFLADALSVSPEVDYLALSSYVGRQSSSDSKRYDVKSLLRESGHISDAGIFSSMLSRTISSHPSADVDIVYIVDPLSVAGQRCAAIMNYIDKHFAMSQSLILSPQLAMSDFPLQHYYKYVFQSSVADFIRLPEHHTLTLRIDTIESWNVQAKSAAQDIDNLKCDAICGDSGTDMTRVEYELKNVLVAGQCFDVTSDKMSMPNGLQLVLTSMTADMRSDTLVMQNLGYYQLQAQPGLFKLSLAAGRASELYHIRDGGDVIAVNSFLNHIHRLNVEKNEGMETVALLDDFDAQKKGAASKSMWSSFSSMFQGNNETIHVFSLATGAVYERLLRIMMLSVVKHTKSHVKFWLFENYLSPHFKESVDVMARKYGFDIGYVTYKWPEWLHQQSEKQRIIWGYKILFLDVLFPLDLKKVIYVDADQVVRSDLKELWDMDLEGKPYAYTPFCSSREETLGFQFWRSGYWADHLRGRPYHISALYVVDLQVFRQFAVGDKLRAVYDSLAKDPNSLSNLDQDLPNYAQHIVPIHSLPQEWLWCESWCSDKSKSKAKTIDLCNNPLHKEPKLDMARR